MTFYSGFAEDYERIFPFREEVYRFLLAHAGGAGGKVLDAGCGPGHYCGRFAADGYLTTGIDLDDAMMAEAGRRYPETTFRLLDMREIEVAGSGFQCIYSIGNVMSHLRQAELPGFIGKVFDMLEPGGSWIMQVMNWDAFSSMTGYEFPMKSFERTGSTATFQRRYDFEGAESVTFSIALVQAGQMLFNERTTLYPVGIGKYLSLHECAGFRCAGSYSDFVRTPLRKEPGTGLVMVFVKP
jgi:cyclopropane fatty-acyl-phospholipid synthase-like methyltransferase